eukprot:scaffold131033_cov19-Tisochrysis_lutea.AAC.1
MSIACTAWHPSSKSMSGLAQRQAVPAPAALQLCFIQYHITSSFAAPARLKIVCRARIALLTHCSMELPALLPLDSPLGSQYHAAWTPKYQKSTFTLQASAIPMTRTVLLTHRSTKLP